MQAAVSDPSPTETELGSRRKVRVVIVDDSATVRDRLAILLTDVSNVEIIGEARDAAEALHVIPDLQPDVVILDIRLPAGSGIGVLRTMRREQQIPKFIVLTNYPYMQYRRTCLEAGASYFFDKSSEFDQIPQALARLAEG
jgi:DNA-binding NarL/FixJ family response regulator